MEKTQRFEHLNSLNLQDKNPETNRSHMVNEYDIDVINHGKSLLLDIDQKFDSLKEMLDLLNVKYLKNKQYIDHKSIISSLSNCIDKKPIIVIDLTLKYLTNVLNFDKEMNQLVIKVQTMLSDLLVIINKLTESKKVLNMCLYGLAYYKRNQNFPNQGI